MTRFKLLGGQYGAHVIVPVVYQSAYMGSRASNTNLGDIIVNPFILGWHGQQWHALAAVDIFLPTGYYNKSDARVSIGANYYGFDPLFAVSYIGKTGWEASGKFMYNLKTTNTATNYHSGQEFHTDYAAGRHIGNWLLGATGYGLKQTTDDMQNGAVVPAAAGLYDIGRRGQVFAIGPSLGYNQRAAYDPDRRLAARDRGAQSLWRRQFWIKAIIPVDGLFSRGPASSGAARPGAPSLRPLSGAGWETTNLMPRKRRLPHRRCLPPRRGYHRPDAPIFSRPDPPHRRRRHLWQNNIYFERVIAASSAISTTTPTRPSRSAKSSPGRAREHPLPRLWPAQLHPRPHRLLQRLSAAPPRKKTSSASATSPAPSPSRRSSFSPASPPPSPSWPPPSLIS